MARRAWRSAWVDAETSLLASTQSAAAARAGLPTTMHVTDSLFSHLIPCRVWEAVNIRERQLKAAERVAVGEMRRSMPVRVAVFSTKPYDRTFLESANVRHGHDLIFFEPRLTQETAALAAGFPPCACLSTTSSMPGRWNSSHSTAHA